METLPLQPQHTLLQGTFCVSVTLHQASCQ